MAAEEMAWLAGRCTLVVDFEPMVRDAIIAIGASALHCDPATHVRPTASFRMRLLTAHSSRPHGSRNFDLIAQPVVARDEHGGLLGQLLAVEGAAVAFEADAAATDSDAEVFDASAGFSPDGLFDRGGQTFRLGQGFRQRMVARSRGVSVSA